MKKLLAKIMIIVCLVSTIGSTWQFDTQAASYYDEESQTIKLLVGESYQIVPKQEVVCWESSNPGIVAVDDTGNISATAYSSNNITITGTHENGTTEIYTICVLKALITKTEITVKQFSSEYLSLNSEGYDTIDVSIGDSSIATFRKTKSSVSLTGVKGGETTLRIKTELGEYTCKVIVATQFVFDSDTYALEKGATKELSFSSRFETCIWENSDDSVAEMNLTSSQLHYKREIVAKKAGTTTITVTNEYGEVASVNIRVYEPYTTLELDCHDITVYLGRPEQLTYTAAPTDTNNKITWSQPEKSEAYFTISQDGVITPKKSSTHLYPDYFMYVTIKSECSKKDTCTVTIKAPYFSASNYSIYKNKTIALASKLTGGNETITWTSSDPSVATVNAKGVVTGLKEGTVTITANSGGYELTTIITVNNPKLSATSATLAIGKTKQLSVTGGTGTVQWSSSDRKVATVSSSGKITAKKPGTATITATVSGEKLTCKVKVKTPSLNVTKKSLVVKQTYTLKISNSTGTAVWKSSNPSVAAVSSSGKITAKKVGKATISVKVNGVTLKCTVTVKKNQKTYSVNKRVSNYSYGSPTLVLQKVYYSGNSLKADVWVINNRMFRASKFDWLNYELYDSNGKLIAKKKFTNVRLNIAPYSSKKITLTFSGKYLKKKNAILPNGVTNDWNYYYTYVY